MRKLMLIALWLGATAAVTAVAYLAVDAAGSQVSDRPLATFSAGASTSAPATSTTVPPDTSLPRTTSTTTSTTSPPATTNTTGSPITSDQWQPRTISTAGGNIVISFRPNEVRLESVAPAAGFTFDIEDSGPREVRVEFQGGAVKVEVRARWRDGGLVTEIDLDD
jgi:hypothetical protein